MAFDWSSTADERLRQEYPRCACLQELAEDIGVTYDALRKRALRLGVKREIGAKTRRNPFMMTEHVAPPKDYLWAELLKGRRF